MKFHLATSDSRTARGLSVGSLVAVVYPMKNGRFCLQTGHCFTAASDPKQPFVLMERQSAFASLLTLSQRYRTD